MLLELLGNSIETGVDCSDEILESLLVPSWMRVDLVILNLVGCQSFCGLVEEDGSGRGLNTTKVRLSTLSINTIQYKGLLTVPISTEMMYSEDMV